MLTPAPAPPPHQPPRRAAGPLPVAVAVTVVAAGLAVWALVAVVVANDDRDDATLALAEAQAAAEPDPVGTVRDEVSVSAEKAIAVLNTIDHRALDEGLGDWAEVTTGEPHDQISSIPADQRRQLVDSGAVSEGRVERLAVRELDVEEWKLSAMTPVAYEEPR